MKQHYRLLHRIGSGGMGAVYAAHKVSDERLTVAIKIMHTDLPSDEREHLAEMFQREAVCSWRFNHDHRGLVTVYDFGTTADDVPYLVMEHVDGVDLASLHRGAEPSYPLIRRIAHDMLEALGHLHDNDLLHRDVSPRNILIAQSGAIKLTDLGLVKERTDDRSGRIHGTHAYSSPEALQGLPRTPSSDLYSLGAVLFQLLAGAQPYGEGRPGDVLAAMYDDDYQRPTLPDDLPDDLAELVDRLTRFAPGERYQTAAEALARLQGPRASRGDVAAAVARSPRSKPDTANMPDLGWPFRDRTASRGTWLTGLALALLITAGLLRLGYGWGNAGTSSDAANPTIATSAQDPATEAETETPRSEEAADLSDTSAESSPAQTKSESPDPLPRARSPRRPSSSEPAPLSAPEDQGESPRFSYTWKE